MKLALGTAQFGLAYGIANQAGQVSRQEVERIVHRARAAGLTMLDTAMGYGDSEQRLGAIGMRDWHVVSKLPAIPGDCEDVGRWVSGAVEQSLQRLGVDRLYALLLHRPGELLEQRGAELYAALQSVRRAGLVERIGASIYAPSELDLLVPRFAFDVVQAPLNVVDARLIESGWLQRLARHGTEVHVRSVFLQGLLLMPPEARPVKFGRWSRLLESYDRWLARTGHTAAQACLGYVLGFPDVARVVIGVDTAAQLDQLVAAASASGVDVPVQLRCDDVDLINPARWAAL